MRPFGWFQTSRDVRPLEGVALGSVVLDTSQIQAPALTVDRRYVLFLDGEIYEAPGTMGQSGAEALLTGWQRDGEKFLARVHGLFNAVIWDREARELTVITDRFGMRPIYVASLPTAFVAASEIKALLAQPGVDTSWSETGFSEFFAFGHFLNDSTLFAGIRALRPATVLVYRAAERRVVESQYWKPRPQPSKAPATEQVRALDDYLVAAVQRRARPRERLGLSLSGGLDARTILGLMPPGLNLSSICIGIEGGIDHRGAAALAAIAGVPHHPYILDSGFLANFETHLRSMVSLTDGHYLDQGIVMTTLPMYRELGIDFLLRGHGGELLHMSKAYSFSLDESGLRLGDAELPDWLYTHLSAYMLKGVPLDIFAFDVPIRARASLGEAIRHTVDADSPVSRVWQLFLNTRLHRETALSMHKFGCFATVRMPYIDNDVVDTLLSMPARMKLGDELQTEILRHRKPAFLKVVNSNTGARMGAGRIVRELARFQMRVGAKLGLKGYQPYERLGLWLKRELKPFVERVLLSDEFLARGLFRPDAVKRVVNEHMTSRANHTFLLMSLLIFELGQQMLSDPEQFRVRQTIVDGAASSGRGPTRSEQ
jgi:asparagine synthase (glutamine-hydrolysing)